MTRLNIAQMSDTNNRSEVIVSTRENYGPTIVNFGYFFNASTLAAGVI